MHSIWDVVKMHFTALLGALFWFTVVQLAMAVDFTEEIHCRDREFELIERLQALPCQATWHKGLLPS